MIGLDERGSQKAKNTREKSLEDSKDLPMIRDTEIPFPKLSPKACRFWNTCSIPK